MLTNRSNHYLDGQARFSQFSVDVTDDYELDQSTEWVNELLTELEEPNEGEATPTPGKLALNLKIMRKALGPYGDRLLVDASFHANYHNPCVRCLAPVALELSGEVKSCFLHGAKEKDEEFQEVTTIFVENDERELYFYHKGIVDLKEMVHEHIFLDAEQFPKCEGECKGEILF